MDPDLVPPYNPTTLTVKEQVQDQFLSIYGAKPASAHWSAENSLFAFFIGINDVKNTFSNKDDALYGKIFDVYNGLIGQIHKAGGRNFLFLNVPPIDRSPWATGQGGEAPALADAAVQEFNTQTAALASSVETSYEGSRVFQLDTHAIYSAVMDDPKSHPETAVYKNVLEFCNEYSKLVYRQSFSTAAPSLCYTLSIDCLLICMNVSSETPDWYTHLPECGIAVHEYLWLDSLHPTFPVHNATAGEVAAILG